jgi:hypothetical protein
MSSNTTLTVADALRVLPDPRFIPHTELSGLGLVRPVE